MYHNHVFASVNHALPVLLEDLDTKGEEFGSRAGRTKELMHVGITLTEPWRREILLPSRKASIAAQIAETAWVLAGRSDVGWLKHYLPRAAEFSDDGRVWRASYGDRLRAWPRRDDENDVVDQLRWVVDHLKGDRGSRRAVMAIWDPVVDTQPGKDIPCNDWLNFSSRLGELDLHVAVRSNDAVWGWSGINQFEWSVLQEVVAGLTGNDIGSLHFSTTSFHIYDRHWAMSKRVQEEKQSPRFLKRSPRFDAHACPTVDALDDLLELWMSIETSIRQGGDRDDEVNRFPEPMLRSWLRVLQWWWTADRDYLDPLRDTALEAATHVSVQPKETPEQRADRHNRAVVQHYSGGKDALRKYLPASAFINVLTKLHLDKDAAYGDSWKRRGEMLGIMANIARKVDRLGTGGETEDETSADTAGDLFVYLAKYQTWLMDGESASTGGPTGRSDDPTYANRVMEDIDRQVAFVPLSKAGIRQCFVGLSENFDQLEQAVVVQDPKRIELVKDMLVAAYTLARTLWEKEYPTIANAEQYSIPVRFVAGVVCNRKCSPVNPDPDCPVHGLGEFRCEICGSRTHDAMGHGGDEREYRGADHD